MDGVMAPSPLLLWGEVLAACIMFLYDSPGSRKCTRHDNNKTLDGRVCVGVVVCVCVCVCSNHTR